MATTKKPTKTATSGGAGAQPPTSSQIPGYGGAATTSNTPTALQTGPYSVLPWTGSDVPVPNDAARTYTPGTTGKGGVTPAAEEAEAIAGLAKYFGLKDDGRTPMKQRVIQALAAKYNVQAETPGSIGTEKVPTGVPEPGGRAGGITAKPGTKTVPTSTPPEPNTKALAQIAQQLNLPADENPLVGIAGALAIPNALTNQGFASTNPLIQTYAPTTAQQYAIWVGRSFNPKTGALTKDGQQDEKALIAAGFLDVNANGGTPSANDVQKAYQSFLGAAVNGVQSGTSATSLQPGAGMQAALNWGQAQAKASQATAGSSESYKYTQGIAAEFGVYLTPNQINNIINDPKVAAEITSTGSPTNVADQIKSMVINDYDPNNPNDPAGVANTMYVGIQQAALKYQVPIAPDAINSMVKNGLGTASVAYPASAATDVVNKATQQFQQQAAGLYPSLAEQIKAGNDVQTLTQPYLQLAQTYTGVPASTMMTETPGGGTSKWARFLDANNNPDAAASANPTSSTSAQAGKQTGPQMMTLDQWKKTLMTDPQYGFQYTQGAKNLASQFTSAILNEFGRVNTGSNNQGAFSAISPSSALAVNT